MRVLIIGGTGVSGYWLVEELLGLGHEVTVFHRGQQEAKFSRPIAHIHGDRQYYEAFATAVSDLAVDAVVDMIAQTAADARSLVEAFGGRVSRAVVISSGDVYQAHLAAWTGAPYTEPFPIAEDAPLRSEPLSYLKALNMPHYDKLHVERVVLEASRKQGFPATVIRYPQLYGPRDSMCREWYWLKRALDRRPHIALPQGGLDIHHRGFGRNMAHAVRLALEEPRAAGQLYNAGDEHVYTNRQLTDAIAEIVGHRWEVVPVPRVLWLFGTPSAADPHLLFDLTKIRRELGYRDVVPPDEALRETVHWLLDHPLEGPTRAMHPCSFDYEAEDEAIRHYRAMVEQ